MAKLHRLLPFFIFIIISLCTYGQDNKKDTLSERDYILHVLKTYTKEGYSIVSTYNNQVSQHLRTDFMDYVDDIKDETIASTINTVVHEICHGYTGELGSVMAKKMNKYGTHYYFFINNDDSMLVELTKTFPSKKMKNEFPDNLKTFRFSYIDTTETILSTQSHGIYGLLDEWNAYTQGTKAGYNLYPYFMKKENIKHCGEYFSGINSTLYGILEFKFFILKYLLYAKKYSKSIFQDILKNDSFKEAFKKISEESRKFISAYIEKKDELYSIIRENGLIIQESNEYLYIRADEFTTTGYSTFFHVYNTLAKEMEKPEYQSMMKDLGVKGNGLHYPEIKTIHGDFSYSDEVISYNDSKEENFVDHESFEPESDVYQGMESDTTLHTVIPSKDKIIHFKDQKGDVQIPCTDILSCSVEYTKDEITLMMKVAELPQKLKINHPDLDSYSLEYEWSFDIDVNNDDKIELSCTLNHVKDSEVKTNIVPIDQALDAGIFKLQGNTLMYMNIPYTLNLTSDSIILKLEKDSHDLISDMNDGFKISFSSYYYDGNNYAADIVD